MTFARGDVASTTDRAFGASKRVQACVSRAHDRDDVASARGSWRDERERASAPFADGFLSVANATARDARSMNEIPSTIALERKGLIDHDANERALEARARKKASGMTRLSLETVRALARSRLAPTSADGVEPSVASLASRLTGFRNMAKKLGVGKGETEEAIDEALDANARARATLEARARVAEAREEEDDDGEAMRGVLNQDRAQLRVIRSQTKGKAALRACVAEMVMSATTKEPRMKSPKSPLAKSKMKGGCLSCWTVDDDDNVSTSGGDVNSAYASEGAESASAVDELMYCVVRLIRAGEELDTFASPSREVSRKATMRWDAMTPNIVCAIEGVCLEISIYAGACDTELYDECDERMDAAVGRRCSVMSSRDVEIGSLLCGRALITVADLGETTRREAPLSVTVALERPSSGDIFGSATVFVDKLMESFDESARESESTGDVLKSTIELVSAIYATGIAEFLSSVPAFVTHQGGCRAVAAVAETFVLCAQWRWEVCYLARLAQCMTEVVAAMSVRRLTAADARDYRELAALISQIAELKLMDCLPSVDAVTNEEVDVVDAEAQGDMIRALIAVFALTFENVSWVKFILRLKKVVRRCARDRCIDLMSKENLTFGSPTLANVTSVIRKSSARLRIDAPILRAFPEEVEALVEASSSTTKFMAALVKSMFDANLSNPPAYDDSMVALDESLADHRQALRTMNLAVSTYAISAQVIDRTLQPALDETLASAQKTLAAWMKKELAAESTSTTPLSPAEGVMHSASCAKLFCVLRNIDTAARAHMLSGDRAVLNATNLGRMCSEVLKTYVETQERACLNSIKVARSHLFQKARSQASELYHEVALVPVGLYTRLSNIHHCVVAMKPFMDEMPLLWCTSAEELQKTLASEIQNGSTDIVDKDENEILYEDSEVPIGDVSRASDFVGHSIVHVLRSARANVIASLVELVEERIASYVRLAVMDNDAGLRASAVKSLFAVLNTELKGMNDNLAPGAFRLALSSMHKGVCDAIEQLILHRPIEEGATGTNDKWKGLEQLSEVQHSFAVELAYEVKEFFYCDGAGTPQSILKDGEARLRRLLNLWFTPTVEVVREFWQLKEELSRSLVEARGRQVRVRQLGGVSVQDILRFLRQRVTDVNAASLVREQSDIITQMNFRALFGNQVDISDGILGAWVCRDCSGLLGRFFVTSSLLAFSTAGMSIDHPHDGRTAIVREIRRIANIARIDAADGTPGLRVTFDDRQSFIFSEFGGLHVGLQTQARERDSCVTMIRTNPAFLQRPAFTQEQLTINYVDTVSNVLDSEISPELAQDIEPPTLPAGEKLIMSTVCQRVVGCARISGKFTVASESCVFLPVLQGAGQIVTYKSMRRSRPQLQNFGWKNADIIIPLAMDDDSVMRLTALTRTQATTLFDALMRAIEA